MLSKRQKRYIKRIIDLKLLFAQNNDLVKSYQPLDTEVAAMLVSLGLVESELPEKDTHGKGDTTAKDTLKAAVAAESSIICGLAKSYAVATGNTTLAQVMGCSYSTVLKMKDTDLLGWVTKQYDLLKPLVGDKDFDEYGITTDMLEKLLSDANTFNSSIGKGTVKDKNSNVANKNINAAIKALNKNVKQFDLLIMHFAVSNPNFVKQYFAIKKLNDAGVKHSGITGQLKAASTGQPVQDALVRLANTTKETNCSLRGVYEITKVRPGEYKLEVVMNDLVVKSLVIDIQRGKILDMDIAI